MRDLWLSMPDSLCTCLDRNLRTELLDFVDMGVKAEVKNRMNGQSTMDTLTADYTETAARPGRLRGLHGTHFQRTCFREFRQLLQHFVAAHCQRFRA